jgi:hypothetical protein
MGSDAMTPPYVHIWARNELLLEEFEAWISDQGLRASTQGYSGEERLPEDVTIDTLDSFLGEWYSRRVAGRCETRLTTMIAALKRFFTFLRDVQRMDEAAADDLLRLLKEDRNVYLDRVKSSP